MGMGCVSDLCWKATDSRFDSRNFSLFVRLIRQDLIKLAEKSSFAVLRDVSTAAVQQDERWNPRDVKTLYRTRKRLTSAITE